MADLFAEKLAILREQRASDRSIQTAKQRQEEAAKLAAEAQADREAAAATRAKWERIGTDGTFLDGIRELGRDPVAEFKRMQQEAIEAGTPEAEIKRVTARFEKQIAEQVEPLKKTIAELQAEREALRTQTTEQGFASDFAGTIKAGEYDNLRDFYSEDALLGRARVLRDDPEQFRSYAEQYKVPLTEPDGSFTMQDILNVLKSAHDEHMTEAEKRRAARTAATPAPGGPSAPPLSPTVNGTEARRNAGVTTIGNDLATERAADGKFVPRGSTAAQRIRERTRRLTGG